MVPAGGVSEDPQRRIRDAIGEISRELPSYQRLVDATPTRNPLPRTRLGKIKRHELGERYERARTEGGEPQQLAPLDIEEMPPGRLFPHLRRLRVNFDTAIDSRRLAEQGEGEDAAARIT